MAPYEFKNFKVTFPRHFVAHVEINRPSKRNAFNEAMWIELKDIFQRLSHDPDARAIILSGAGNHAFSTGMDFGSSTVTDMVQREFDDPVRKAAVVRRWIHQVQECFSAVHQCEKRMLTLSPGMICIN